MKQIYPASEHDKLSSFWLDDGLWTRVRNVLLVLLAASWLASAAGWILDTKQFDRSYFCGFVYFITIGLGGLFFLMMQFLTGAAWSVTVRRFMETVAARLPAGLLLFVPVAFALPGVFESAREYDHPLIQLNAG